MTARDRILVAALGAVAALAAFWFLALGPVRAEAEKTGAEIAAQRQRLESAQTALAQASQAKAQYHEDYATVVRLGKAVPADDNLPSLLHQLQSAARGARVDFRSIARGAASSPSGSGSADVAQSASAALPPGATVGAAGLATLPFTFTYRGSFFDLQRFLGNVQDFVRTRGDSISVSGRLLTVDGVSLVAGTDGLRKIEAKLAATAYLLPESRRPGNAAAASGAPNQTTDAGTPSTQTAMVATQGAP